MLTEVLLSQAALLEQAHPVESLGQRSIRLFRQDLRSVVSSTYEEKPDANAIDFLDSAAITMIAARPKQINAIGNSLGTMMIQLQNTRDLLEDPPPYISFNHDEINTGSLLRIIAANQLNLLIEVLVYSHPLMTAGKESIELPVGENNDVVIIPDRLRGDMHDVRPTVFMRNGVSFVSLGEKAKWLAWPVADLLSVVGREPEVERVSSVIFTQALPLGSGRFGPIGKHVTIGSNISNKDRRFANADIYTAFGVALHEFIHGDQFDGRRNTQYPSLLNELEAMHKTFNAFSSFPRGMIVSDDSGAGDYGSVLQGISRRYKSLRTMISDPNPKTSSFADHNIKVHQEESDAHAASINVDLFPF